MVILQIVAEDLNDETLDKYKNRSFISLVNEENLNENITSIVYGKKLHEKINEPTWTYTTKELKYASKLDNLVQQELNKFFSCKIESLDPIINKTSIEDIVILLGENPVLDVGEFSIYFLNVGKKIIYSIQKDGLEFVKDLWIFPDYIDYLDWVAKRVKTCFISFSDFSSIGQLKNNNILFLDLLIQSKYGIKISEEEIIKDFSGIRELSRVDVLLYMSEIGRLN